MMILSPLILLSLTDDMPLPIQEQESSLATSLSPDQRAACEPFSFDPIQPDFLFESCKSKLVEFKNIANKNFALDQTHAHIGLNKLVDFRPNDLPRQFIHDDPYF